MRYLSRLTTILLLLGIAVTPLAAETATVDLTILTWNILHGANGEGVLDLAAQGRYIADQDADLVFLQEIDEGTERTGRVDQMAVLGHLTAMSPAFAASMPLQGGRYGLGMLSALSVASTRSLRLPEGTQPKVAFLRRVQVLNRPLLAVNLHFDWIEDDTARFAQAQTLLAELSTLDLPMIVAGDFNDAPGSRTMQAFYDAGFQHVEAPGPSWNAREPSKDIDHILVRSGPGLDLEPLDGEVLAEPSLSDHRPVRGRVRVRRNDSEPILQALSLGDAVEGSLAADGRVEYAVDLEAGQFVYGEVEQVDVDVKVTILDPRGDIAGNFNESHRGAEPVQLEPEATGRFRVRVEPVEQQTGSFRLALQRIEPVATDPAERLDQLLSAFAGDDVPGAIVAVMKDGEIVHSQAVGMANLTYGIPFERQTVSNIGSVSKQFTAFAVARLAADGALSLDDDVRQYFPELPDLGETVTVRQLLDHTSGYREFLNLLALAGVRLDKGDWIDRDEVLRILERQPELQEEPGTLYNYNNTAYSLAALLLERVTDTPFQEWMTGNVFGPLGMTHTRIRSHTGEIIPDAADGYLYAEEAPFSQAIDLGGGGGATMGPGGVYTTVDDMAHWVRNLHTAAYGGPEILGDMTTPQIETPGGPDHHYGLGLFVETYRGQPLVQHGGADTAHRAMLLFFPEINAAVFAMSNHGAFDSGTIARRTADAFFAEHFAPEEEAAAGSALTGAEAAADRRIDPSLFDPHLGKYELDDYPGVVITVLREGEQLFIHSGDGDPLPVSATTPTTLSVPPDTTIVFHLARDGRADSLTLRGENQLTARRLEAWAPSAEELAEYEGLYFSDELETFYTVAMGDDGLIIQHRRLDDIELAPKVRDSFSATFPISDVVFDRDEAGQVTGMRVSNIRTRNIRFTKQP